MRPGEAKTGGEDLMRNQMVRSAAAALLAFGTITATAPQALAVTPSPCGLVQYQNGTVGPTLCPDGHPNSRVQSSLKAMTPRLMALNRGARWAAIKKAACADAPNSSNQMVANAYVWQYARLNWRGKNVTPRKFVWRLINGMCPPRIPY